MVIADMNKHAINDRDENKMNWTKPVYPRRMVIYLRTSLNMHGFTCSCGRKKCIDFRYPQLGLSWLRQGASIWCKAHLAESCSASKLCIGSPTREYWVANHIVLR